MAASLLHAGLGVGEVGVILGDLQQVILVGGDSQDDFLDVLGVVGAHTAVDIGAAPVAFRGRIGNAPGGEQEGEDTGLGAHGLVPVVIPLTLDGLVQIAGIQPGLGGLDPVRDLLINNIKFMT